MAPEQARARPGTIGPAADVWALGVILYEMLTGRPPFLGEDVLATLDRVCNQEPIPPVQLRAGTPRDLQTITLKCLRKEPRRRYGTALALAEDLRRWLDGRPIVARPVGPLERAGRWCLRNPVVAALLAAVVLTVLLGSGFSVWFGVQATVTAAALRKQSGELENTNARLAAEKANAESAGQEATRRKEEAERQLLRNQWLLYASSLDKASRELDPDNKDPRGRERALALLSGCPWDFRHWEHAYLRHLAAGGKPIRHPLPGGIDYDELTPDGLHLVTRDKEGTLQLWDLTTGKLVRAIGTHQAQSRVARVSPEGRLLATGGTFGPVKVWDVAAGREMAALSHKDGAPVSPRDLRFSPDGKSLITVSTLGIVTEWDVAAGQPRRTVTIVTDSLANHFLLGPGDRLFTARNAGRGADVVDTWDLRTGKQLSACRGALYSVNCLACSPDGKWVAAGDATRAVRVWDPASGQLRFTLNGHKDIPTWLTFTPDGKRLVSAAGEELRIWDLTGFGQELLTLKTPSPWVSFSRDGRRLAIFSAAEVVLWETSPAEPDVLAVPTGQGRTAGVAFTADGKRIVTGGGPLRQAGLVQLFDAATGQELLRLAGHQDRVNGVAVGRDGRTIVSGGGEDWPNEGNGHLSQPGEVKVWDVQTRQCLYTLRDHGGAVWAVALSPDGTLLASGSQDRTVHLYDASTGERVRTLEGHAREVQCVAFSPNGAYLVSGGGELGRPGDKDRPDPNAKDFVGEVIVWEPSTGQRVRTFALAGASVNGVCFSPDGKAVAAGVGRWTDDPRGFHQGEVKVWEVTSGQERLSLDAGLAAVHSVAFSPDGLRLAAGRGEAGNTPALALLWEVATGKPLLRSGGNLQALVSVAFDPTGNRLVGGDAYGGGIVWGVPPEEPPVPGWQHR
jgi:WD40 repeat protein